ncbi:dnaJ homolog subfamily B member 9a [Synchiropus picturatus]
MATVQSALTYAVCILTITELLLATKDYYDILGVPKDASERQIKKAFHKLAMKYHPDRNNNPNAEARFREIAEAYETLSDKTKRREYDQLSARDSFFSEESEGERRNSGHQHYTSNFDDIFKDFDFYNQKRNRRPFDDHFRSHKESRHNRHFHRGFAADMLDDMFDDVERMFTFEQTTKQTGSRFHGSFMKQHCRTVTQRRGNMVSTYTECSTS